MLGKLLNSLNYLVEKDMREWKNTNKIKRLHAWPWYKAVFIAAEQNRVLTLSLMVITALAGSVLAGVFHVVCNPKYSATMQQSINENFTTVWTIQATIAALIYPIIIGLVSLLLQRKHAAKATLSIYFRDSATAFTSISALLLLLIMAVQQLFISSVGKGTPYFFVVIDTSWFALNILGAVWSMWRSFSFLNAESRARTIQEHVINYTLESEVYQSLQDDFFIYAVKKALVPGPAYGKPKDKSKVSVHINYLLSSRYGRIQVTKKDNREQVVSDVRFRLLSKAISLLKDRVVKEDQKNNQPLYLKSQPPNYRMVIFPSFPGRVFNPDVGLCRTTDGIDLTRREKFLIRGSFVLSRNTRTPVDFTINDMFQELVAEALVAIQAGEKHSFRGAMDELVDFHATILNAAAYEDEQGSCKNYLLLSSRKATLGRSVHFSCMREYHKITEKAVDCLLSNPDHFTYLTSVPVILARRVMGLNPVEANFLGEFSGLHYQLNEWWSQTIQKQGAESHGPLQPQLLAEPARRHYKSAIGSFVGQLETFGEDFLPNHDRTRDSWKDKQELSQIFMFHTSDTLQMLFSNVMVGNDDGAEQVYNSLSHRKKKLAKKSSDLDYFTAAQHKISLITLGASWEDARKMLDIENLQIGEAVLHDAVWFTGTLNYLVDVLYVSLSILIGLGKNGEDNANFSMLVKLVVQIIRDSAHEGKKITNNLGGLEDKIDVFLLMQMRLHFFDGKYYQNILDEMVSSLPLDEEPEMVPRRLYVAGISDRTHQFRESQLILLCLLMEKQGWNPSKNLLRQIHNWGVRDTEGLESYKNLLKSWLSLLQDGDSTLYKDYEKIYSLLEKEINALDFLEAEKGLENGLNKMVSFIDEIHPEQLRDKEVNKERLSEVKKFASEFGFDSENTVALISLFKDVQHASEKLQEGSITMTNLNKSEFTEPPLLEPSANEKSIYISYIRSYLPPQIMDEILRQTDASVFEAESLGAYAQKIKDMAKNMEQKSLEPILFVGGTYAKNLYIDLSGGSRYDGLDSPYGIKSMRDKKYADMEGYIGSLDAIPVFLVPLPSNTSLLIPRESLAVIKFTELDGGIYVDVDHEISEENEALINIKLSWYFEVTVRTSESLKIIYEESKES